MHLEHSDLIDAPQDFVYHLVRDDLDKLVKHLPNIRKIEALEYQKQGKIVQIVNHWFAKAQMPSMVASFIKEDLFAWKDYATWDDSAHKVDYQLESFLAKDIFEAKGCNEFIDRGDQTELKISCEITIHADKIPGIPRLLSRKVTPVVEKLLEKILAPNMTSLGEGIKSYLKAHK